MLISVLGNVGQGKTLFLVRQSTVIEKPIWSNFKIDVPNYKPLDIINLMELDDNITVFLDEAYVWLESRTPAKYLNRYLSYLIFQSRKRGLDIYITAQLYSSIDVRFRDQSNMIIYCKKTSKGFLYTLEKQSSLRRKRIIIPFKNARKYYSLYDTYEIIEPNQKDELEFAIIKQNPKLLKAKVKDIARAINEQLAQITHDSVKSALLVNGFPLGYEPYIYVYLKALHQYNDNELE